MPDPRPCAMLWIPGPTEVRPEVLAELSRPPIGHRTPGMAELGLTKLKLLKNLAYLLRKL